MRKKCLLTCLSLLLLSPLYATLTEAAPIRPFLVAYYYPWYGTPWGPVGKWFHWCNYGHKPYVLSCSETWRRDIFAPGYPLIGPYDSLDPEIVRWHIRLAKSAGIDAFLVSWFGYHEADGSPNITMRAFEEVLLPVAEEENFKVAIFDELAHYKKDFSALLSRTLRYLPRYKDHPAYFRINGQPVWYIYQVWEDWLTPAKLSEYCQKVEAQVGDVFWIFDGMRARPTAKPGFPGIELYTKPEFLSIPQIDCFTSYSLFTNWRLEEYEDIKTVYLDYAQKVHSAGKFLMLPLHPGHDNSLKAKSPYIAPRQRGELLRNFIKAASQAKPEFFAICSFNEWHEGTHIEPDITWHDPYSYLRIIAHWRTLQFQPPPIPIDSIDPLILNHPKALKLIKSSCQKQKGR